MKSKATKLRPKKSAASTKASLKTKSAGKKKRATVKNVKCNDLFPNGFVKTKDGFAIAIEKGPRGGLYYKEQAPNTEPTAPNVVKTKYLNARR